MGTSPRNMMRTFLLSATLAISMSTVVLCDIFDDLDDVDESPEALRNITGPGIPDYKEGEPHHYLETRNNWREADYDKDGKLTAEDLQQYFYDQFYKDHGVLTCGNDTTDRARSVMDGEGLVSELDKNKDNHLDFEEYSTQYEPQ